MSPPRKPATSPTVTPMTTAMTAAAMRTAIAIVGSVSAVVVMRNPSAPLGRDIDPRVYPGVGNVHQQVEYQKQRRLHHHRAQDQRAVAVQDRVHEVLAQARDIEYLLDHE